MTDFSSPHARHSAPQPDVAGDGNGPKLDQREQRLTGYLEQFRREGFAVIPKDIALANPEALKTLDVQAPLLRYLPTRDLAGMALGTAGIFIDFPALGPPETRFLLRSAEREVMQAIRESGCEQLLSAARDTEAIAIGVVRANRCMDDEGLGPHSDDEHPALKDVIRDTLLIYPWGDKGRPLEIETAPDVWIPVPVSENEVFLMRANIRHRLLPREGAELRYSIVISSRSDSSD